MFLHHQRIHVGRDESGDHPTFDTWPSGRASRSAVSSVALAPDASQTRSAPMGQMSRTISSRFSVSMSTVCVAPKPACGLEARPVRRQAGDDERAGARQRRHPRAQQADGAWPDDDDEIARRDSRVDAHHLIGDRVRLGQARDVEGQRIGDVVQASRRHADELRHGAVDAVAEPLALRAQVVAARAAEQARSANLGRRLADDAVALAKAGDAAAEPGDGAAELMAEDDRDVDRPRMRVARLVDVGAAHRDRPDFEQHLAVANLWNRVSRAARRRAARARSGRRRSDWSWITGIHRCRSFPQGEPPARTTSDLKAWQDPASRGAEASA